jgi:hypothetical protein
VNAGLVAGAYLLAAAGAGADPGAGTPSVGIELRRPAEAPQTALRIGERLRLELHLLIPAGYEVGEPRLAEVGEEFVLQQIGEPSGSAAPDGGLVKVIPLTVVPFQVGELEFPGIVVPWSGPDQAAGESRSATLPVLVQATVEDLDEAPADIRGPAGMVVPRAFPWWILAALLLALAAAVVWWRWRRRPARARPTPAAPRPDPFGGLSPAAWALQALDQLIQDNFLGRHGAEAYHVRLSEIVRRYLDGQFGLEALERTTSEILFGVESRLRPIGGARARLRRVLSACDLVKFAGQRPGESEALALTRTARRFVEETRPPELAPVESR